MVISSRLSILVEEKAKGNRKAFAAKAGLKQATFNNYIKKGRPPTVDALNNICNTYDVNLNWLVSGLGPKYIADQDTTQCLDPDPKISKLLERARQILTSNNPNAAAMLEMHINQIESTIKADKERDELKRKIAQLEQERLRDQAEHKEEQSPDEKVA